MSGYGRALPGCARSNNAWSAVPVAAEFALDMIRTMTNLIQEAIQVLRELPEERQEVILRAIFDYTSQAADEAHEI